ncbi:MAG: thiamine pyrophosphate-binding protein [SAR324 cluster bacterium]|nr:thiamine pyrophosphate-binding protein [SAR324 cluster bacterium]MCZ6730844.1 thiamine pyrophosphate-binding protein [SAR324 cluster bacterium]
MAEIKGAVLIAQCLKRQGVEEVFGLVGYPVVEVGHRIQEAGIRFIGTRHEQAACFAAQGAGYLRRRPGVALTVSGPGMTNAITAMGNAQANCWPLLVISGSSDSPLANRGAFQEAPQMEAARPFCKWVAQARRVEEIPRLIEQGLRQAWYGRPGATYLDLPADVIDGVVDEGLIKHPPLLAEPPREGSSLALVDEALRALREAERPLAIVGKGAAWADAAPELIRLLEQTGIPFLPTPMGKGVVPDDHPASVAAARSYALANADTILLAGARFNWIMHFGLEPRYRPDVKVVQIDIAPEELSTNVPAAIGIAGDLKAVLGQMAARLEEEPWRLDPKAPWLKELAGEVEKKKNELQPALESSEVPMGFYRPLSEIQKLLPRETLFIAEGSNTMDISRSVIENYLPRHRLDAGTWGTMGVGCGFALAAAVVHPEKPVVALMGDGAFGFDGMEVEVAVRYKLPIVWIIFANNGIGRGVAGWPEDEPPPVNVYTPGSRYDKVIEAFGGTGYHCDTPEQLAQALQKALDKREPALINVPIAPEANRAPQSHHWLSR